MKKYLLTVGTCAVISKRTNVEQLASSMFIEIEDKNHNMLFGGRLYKIENRDIAEYKINKEDIERIALDLAEKIINNKVEYSDNGAWIETVIIIDDTEETIDSKIEKLVSDFVNNDLDIYEFRVDKNFNNTLALLNIKFIIRKEI